MMYEFMIDAWAVHCQGANLQDDADGSTTEYDPNSPNTAPMDASGSEREDSNIVSEGRPQRKVAATPERLETPQDKEEEDLASLEKTWGRRT